MTVIYGVLCPISRAVKSVEMWIMYLLLIRKQLVNTLSYLTVDLSCWVCLEAM